MDKLIQFDLLSLEQKSLVNSPLQSSIFLEGPAGSGKTTAAIHRLMWLLEEGVNANTILVLLPQQTLSRPYNQVLLETSLGEKGVFTITTISGLVQRMVRLFWPAISAEAGFWNPYQSPSFLTRETSQYYMAHIVRPLMDEGYFESVVLDRHRLYSQILDNLNKSALVGFSHTEIGERLKSAWIGEPVQLSIYDDVQTCSSLFREFCYQHNLLDWSLQMEIFRDHLWLNEFVKAYLQNTYHHLVFDNTEEDMPVTHDIVLEWLPKFDSSMIIYDQDGGFRKFLGADPISAYRLKDQCRAKLKFQNLFSSSLELSELAMKLTHFIVSNSGSEDGLNSIVIPSVPEAGKSTPVILGEEQADADAGSRNSFPLIVKRKKFFPEMLDWITEQVRNLIVNKNVPMEEIVILSPYLPDTLRFSIQINLEREGIQVRSHRPSRPLGDEPATQCLLTLAKIAIPELGFIPARSDVAQALFLAIEDLDLIRANLLTEIVYRTLNHKPVLTSFDLIQGDAQERITYVVGQRYEILREWLVEIGTNLISVGGDIDGLDYFFTRLFGEVLSQPGFGFHTTLDHGVITANLIQSIRNFRQSMRPAGGVSEPQFRRDATEMEETFLAREYLLMVEDGLLAAQYIPGWQARHEQGVLISPAFSFIMSNVPVDYQIWLDIGSRGWYERLDQPLTHPYVLNRNWKKGNAWTEFDEISVGEAQLSNLVWGLIRRCRKAIFVGLSKYDDQGFETSGLLLQAIVAVSVDKAKANKYE